MTREDKEPLSAPCCDSEHMELAGVRALRSAKEEQEAGLNVCIVPDIPPWIP